MREIKQYLLLVEDLGSKEKYKVGASFSTLSLCRGQPALTSFPCLFFCASEILCWQNLHTNFCYWALCVCVCAYLLQSCTALCNPMDCGLLGSSVHGILQARILECVACPPPGDLPNSGTEPTFLTFSALAGGFFTTTTTWEALIANECLLNGKYSISS